LTPHIELQYDYGAEKKNTCLSKDENKLYFKTNFYAKNNIEEPIAVYPYNSGIFPQL
jgi:hypothetical protein